MYVNGKVVPVESFPRMVEGGIKENGGEDEIKYNIFNIL
jgi:hypothetical protein